MDRLYKTLPPATTEYTFLSNVPLNIYLNLFWAIKIVWTNLEGFKSYRLSPLDIVELS